MGGKALVSLEKQLSWSNTSVELIGGVKVGAMGEASCSFEGSFVCMFSCVHDTYLTQIERSGAERSEENVSERAKHTGRPSCGGRRAFCAGGEGRRRASCARW